jgi:hypothetical protein
MVQAPQSRSLAKISDTLRPKNNKKITTMRAGPVIPPRGHRCRPNLLPQPCRERGGIADEVPNLEKKVCDRQPFGAAR